MPITADIITVVDESGSMSGEHAWLGGMITSLHSALGATAGSDPLSAQYGLVGFGASGAHGTAGHQHNVGGAGSQFGTAAEFSTATGGLVISGATEDGYSGIDTALGYALRPSAATNVILVTDEDRDAFNVSLNYSSILTSLLSEKALLNSVVNCLFADGSGTRALGIDSKGNAYIADGAGGFTKSSGGVQSGSCFGTTKANYVDLALATGGAAWDLNLLRAGGLTATSFTTAFIDIKVGEIVQQQSVPEPATLALLGLGLAGIGYGRRRARARG